MILTRTRMLLKAVKWKLKWKQVTNKKTEPVEWFWCRYMVVWVFGVWFYFKFTYFYVKLVYSKAGYNKPIKR